MRCAVVLLVVVTGCHPGRPPASDPASSAPTSSAPTPRASAPADRAPRPTIEPPSPRVATLVDRFERGGRFVWLERTDAGPRCVEFTIPPPKPDEDADAITQWTETEPGAAVGEVCERRWTTRFGTFVGDGGIGPLRRDRVTLLGPHTELVSQSDTCVGGAGGLSLGCAESLQLAEGPRGSVRAGDYLWFLDVDSCEDARERVEVPTGGGC